MRALILAAGRGTRLYPLTINKPKSLLKIGSRTVLGRLVDQFKNMMISEITIVVGFKKEMIIEEFKNDASSWRSDYLFCRYNSRKRNN